MRFAAWIAVCMYICCVCVHVPSKCSFFFFFSSGGCQFSLLILFEAKHVLAMAQKEKRLGDSGANVGIPAENRRESKKKLEERVPGFVFGNSFSMFLDSLLRISLLYLLLYCTQVVTPASWIIIAKDMLLLKSCILGRGLPHSHYFFAWWWLCCDLTSIWVASLLS